MGVLDQIRGVSKRASSAVSPQRLAELASKAKQAGHIAPHIEQLLDESLGVTATSPPLPRDPPSPAADKAFQHMERQMALLGEGIDTGKDSVSLTPRQVLSRWYVNTPGGFDGAVESSQDALRKYGVVYPHSNSPAYGNWSAENVDAPVRVRIDTNMKPLGPRGTYGEGGVRLNPALLEATKLRNGTLEHELTHHLTLHGDSRPDEPTLLAVQRVGNRRERFDSTPEGSATLRTNPELALIYEKSSVPEMRGDAEKALRPLVDQERYAMGRVEVDPRIAEVRRRYAYHTGKDVTTPDEAAQAWDWYRANRDHFENPTLRSPLERPSMQPSHFDMYDSLPPESKQIMFARMTQVPALLAPIGAGAAGGILNGLLENR